MRAVPRNWVSWDFVIFERDLEVADIDVAWFREAADVQVQGAPYRMARAGYMSGTFELLQGGQVVASARKPSAFRRAFLVEFEDRRYTLSPESMSGRAYVLRHDGVTVGGVRRETWRNRKVRAELPDALPRPVRVFVLWLVLLMWKRESDSSGGSAGAVASS